MTRTRSPVLFVVGLVLLSTLSFVPAAAGAAAPTEGTTFQVDDNETATGTETPTDDGPTFDDNETDTNMTGDGTAQTTGETVDVSNSTLDALKNQTRRIAYYVEGLKNRTVYQVQLFEGLPESVSATGDELSGLSDTPSAERNSSIDAIRSDLDEQRETLLRYQTQAQWQLDVARAYLEKIEELNGTVESIGTATAREAMQKHLGFHAREVRGLIDNLETQVNATRTALQNTIALDQGLGELRNQTAPETPTPGENASDQDTPIFEDDDGTEGAFSEEVSVSDLTPLQTERANAVENVSTKLDEQIEIVRNLDAYLAQGTELVATIDNGEVPDPDQVEQLSTPTDDGTTGGDDATGGDGGADEGTPATDGDTNESGNESDDAGGAGAIGPGFAPVTALVAVALAVAIVLARRRQQ